MQTVVIARAPLYDADQLAAGGVAGPPGSPLEAAFAEAYRSEAELLVARAVARRAGGLALMPACYTGAAAAAGDAWRRETVDGVSIEQALDTFFFVPQAPLGARIIIDRCTGFACGDGCVKD